MTTIAFPPIPHVIESYKGPVRVIRARRIVSGGIECDGLWTSEARTIHVRKPLSRSRAWWVFYHEEAHMQLEDGDVELPEDLEEEVCNAIASARLADLTRSLRRTKKRPVTKVTA